MNMIVNILGAREWNFTKNINKKCIKKKWMYYSIVSVCMKTYYCENLIKLLSMNWINGLRKFHWINHFKTFVLYFHLVWMHLFILSLASVLALLIEVSRVSVDVSSSDSVDKSSSGYSLHIGLDVVPLLVRKMADLQSPSLPWINFVMTAMFHIVLGVSSCICTTSPTFMFCVLFPRLVFL